MTFVVWWVGLALGTVVWIMMTEAMHIALRGPEYWLWIKESSSQDEDQSEHWLVVAAFVLVFWWRMLFEWCRAAWNKQTFFEYLTGEKDRIVAKKEALVVRAAELTAELVIELEKTAELERRLFEHQVDSLTISVVVQMKANVGRDLKAFEIEDIRERTRKHLLEDQS